jgi:hypothetical protein
MEVLSWFRKNERLAARMRIGREAMSSGPKNSRGIAFARRRRCKGPAIRD